VTTEGADDVTSARSSGLNGPQPRSPAPFRVGFAAAVGVGIAYLIYNALTDALDNLVLVGLALFFAAGLDPLVRLAQRLGLRRGPAIGAVFLLLLALCAAVGFVVVPPLVEQVTGFVGKLPGYLTDLQANPRIASLDARVHLLDRARDYLSTGHLLNSIAGNVVSAGTAVATAIFEGFSVLILTLYFMAYLDELIEFGYRMVPRSRRERAELIGGKLTEQIGSYVAGNIGMGLLAGVIALAWFMAIRAPFPLALAFAVGILDVLPLIGAPVAILVVSLVVGIGSIPLGIATFVFFVLYQQFENHLLMPRLVPPTVRINPAATIVGALAGFTLLGVIGFILAIPLVAVVNLLLREVVVPRQAAR
jgi:predicted PurR-regulated permease PerM